MVIVIGSLDSMYGSLGSDVLKQEATTISIVRARDDLTLFCEIYNVFLMFSKIFFCAEFKSDECQLEKFKHFCRGNLFLKLV